MSVNELKIPYVRPQLSAWTPTAVTGASLFSLEAWLMVSVPHSPCKKLPYIHSTSLSAFPALTSDSQALAQQQNQVEVMEDEVNSLETTAHSLKSALLALIGWVVLVTLALATLAFVTYRRWKRNSSEYTFDGKSSVDSVSTTSGSEIPDSFSSSPQNEYSRGLSNEGYDPEDMSPLEVTVERFEPAKVHNSANSSGLEDSLHEPSERL